MKIGTELKDRFHLRSLGKLAGDAIESIRINSLSVEPRNGRPFFVKRRRAAAKPIAALANLFFPLAGNLISVWVDPAKWQRWEIDNFLLLNGDRFEAFAEGEKTVCADKVPGENLRQLLARGALTRHILEVSAKELRRAHQLWCPQLDGRWSHGDLQMSNLVYDGDTDTARIIDFEIIHNPSLSAEERHADDLLVFLQDMMWRVAPQQWVPFAMAFINAYGRPEVIAELKRNLIVPHGIPGVWWEVRTNHFNRAELERRVAALRAALDLTPADRPMAAARDHLPALRLETVQRSSCQKPARF